MDLNTKLLGRRIATRLTEMNKTQRWLAEKLEVSDQAVTKWRSGSSSPEFGKLRALARALQCSIGYLAGDEADDTIAEATRLMSNLTDDGRKTALVALQAVYATLPKRNQQVKQA